MENLKKLSKKALFYKEIKSIIEKNVSEKIKIFGFSPDLKNDMDFKIKEFLDSQTILKRTKSVWDNGVYMYIMGEILSKYMKFKSDNKYDKVNELSKIIYSMFLYSESCVVAPDVLLIRCSTDWERYLFN